MFFLLKKALKDLEKLEVRYRELIISKLKQFREKPYHYARKLANSEIGTYRFRVGDYRIIADIEEDKLIVLRLGHRKDIYR